MKKFYETICEMWKNGEYYPNISNKCEDSQFLNSKPQQPPLIGIIPMTGEGIDAQVDDLAFYNDNNIETEPLELDKKKKNPTLIHKLHNKFRK